METEAGKITVKLEGEKGEREQSLEVHMSEGTKAMAAASRKRKAEEADLQDPDQDKRLKLLEKNRLSARECRRRKKEKVQMLENKVQELTQQIHDMQAANSAPTKKEILLVRRQTVDSIGQIINDPGVASMFNRNKKAKLQDLECLNSKMQPLLHQIHKLVGDRVIEPVEDYFKRIEDLLMPIDITKFIMWALSQPETFYNEGEGTGEEGLWDLMVHELELTEAQKAELLKIRPIMVALRSEFQGVVVRLRKTAEEVNSWLSNIKKHLTDVQVMLTPMQQAKFLWWTEQNLALMRTVESMWRDPSVFAPPPLYEIHQHGGESSGTSAGNEGMSFSAPAEDRDAPYPTQPPTPQTGSAPEAYSATDESLIFQDAAQGGAAVLGRSNLGLSPGTFGSRVQSYLDDGTDKDSDLFNL
mmetsp:Transcript_18985/g.53266  ORF Transcript_18985/g.53266 Transcript_18985/m.53266 type:complete len:414 (-) Transcript_18985:209-1450(-)